MVEHDKNHILKGIFFCGIFLGFLMVQPMPIWIYRYNLCFTHTDSHYKLYYKLLTPYAYLILTLYLLKMTKNHFFYVFRWWCKDLMPTRLMDR